MKLKFAMLASLVAMLPAHAAMAQQAGDVGEGQGSAVDSGGLSDIIVTAQRRSQSQQSVPITITTISAETLGATGISATDDLVQMTPGLTFTRQLKGATPYIRGVGTQSVAAGVESPIATYIDGVYYMSAVGNVFSFNNIERVEVLKGPQGTLFGRNATGGLINVITRKPSYDTSLEGSLSFDNYATLEGKAYATTGLSDNLAIDLAVQYERQYDGFGRYIATGDDALYRRSGGLRSKIQWEPTSEDRLTLSADWSRDNSDLGATRDVVAGTVSALGIRPAGGFYDMQGDYETKVRTDYWGVSLQYERQLGSGSLTILNAFRQLKSQVNIDLDSTGAPFLVAQIHESNRTWQTEILYNGSLPNFEYTVGAFYFNARSAYDPLTITSAFIPSQNYSTYPVQDTRSYAGYAQGTYDLGQSTQFTAGLRFTNDAREFSAERYALAPNPAGAGTILLTRARTKANYSKLTWRLALDQKLADHVMAYVSYDRGFKSGVFNSAQELQPPVRPETLDAYTLGLKSELFDRTLRLNIAGFHYDYKDIQLARLENGTLFLLNAAQGRINGAEVEGVFSPRLANGRLDINFGATYLDAKYKSFPDGPSLVPAPGVCTPTPHSTGTPTGGNVSCSTDLSGNRMVRSPKFAFNIGGTYAIPVGQTELALTMNYAWTGKYFWEADNRMVQDSYDLLNATARLGFGPDQRFGISVFGKNLTNSHYSSYQTQSALGDTQSPAPPRTYGAAIDFKF
ncbi:MULTISPECIES: TonB-dependent receptor [Sphingobium]|uniref:TonB-dependent receptor n=1 Tax=Sphingobium TaxID=165695 RepID=UPI00159C7B80|nr:MULTISPECIES: TonB-dependent receptor [unclassified Sphingobium]